MFHSRIAALALAAGLMAAGTGLAQTAVWPPIADPPTTLRNPGRFVWADLVTNDVGAAAAFYGKVFGWTFETFGPADDDLKSYTQVIANSQPIGGMVFGGDAVLVKPRQLGQRGEVGLFRDNTGAVFGAINSASGDPDDYLGDVGEWLWIELWTAEPQRAIDFYRGVFGYDSWTRDEGRSYAFTKDGVARVGGSRSPSGCRAAARGFRTCAWPTSMPRCSACATPGARGGRAAALPRHAGGLFVDPVGAPFAVAEWKRQGG